MVEAEHEERQRLCGFCGQVHDVGPGRTVLGLKVWTCDVIPEGAVYFAPPDDELGS